MTDLTQEQFNELMYWSLQSFQACNRAWVANPNRGMNQEEWILQGFMMPELFKNLFHERMRAVEQVSMSGHLYARMKHHIEYMGYLYRALQSIGEGHQLPDALQELIGKKPPQSFFDVVTDYMGAIAQASDNQMAEEERLMIEQAEAREKKYPYINLPYVLGLVDKHYENDDPIYLQKYAFYKRSMTNILNAYFETQYDYTYTNQEKPWIMTHIAQLYGPEILAGFVATLAAYMISPTSLLARIAVLEIPSTLLGAAAALPIMASLNQLDLPKTYLMNPHQHVTIWLSRDPDLFLSFENQLRLIKMRNTNPTDDIHFVYAKSLLNEKSINELTSFCHQYHIKAHCIEEDIIPECKTEREYTLIQLYQNEIKNLHAGCNLASLSDILRWLSPIYTLGTYKDFDEPVDTSSLPKNLEVRAPLLMPVGSWMIDSHDKDDEIIALNNDIITVVESDSAKPYIESIQQTIINACSSRHIFQDIYAEQKNKLEQITSDFANNSELMNLKCLAYIEQQYQPKSLAELRFLIQDLFSSNEKMTQLFTKMTLSENGGVLQAIDVQSDFPSFSESELSSIRHGLLEQLMKSSVMYTTGPNAVIRGLFNAGMLPKATIDKKVASFSYLSYPELCSAWNDIKGTVVRGFHQNPADLAAPIVAVQDNSWLPSGQLKANNRQQAMTESASKIQALYRKYKKQANLSQQDEADTDNLPKLNKNA